MCMILILQIVLNGFNIASTKHFTVQRNISTFKYITSKEYGIIYVSRNIVDSSSRTLFKLYI